MRTLDESERRVAIYARYSTDRQDARSIEDQTRRCRAFAEARGWTVVAEYKDEALSGAHVERPDLQRLLGEARLRECRRFSAVLVDDLSRLSRDLGATWQIIFADLAAVAVRVTDCTSGMSSDDPNARLLFGATALVNDTFLQFVRTETHRGLEGRAILGFATGGRTYGYVTQQEPNPPDPLRPRKVRVIAADQAETVKRIFGLYAEGMSYKAIAALLNDEGLPSPYDGTRWRAKRRGWSPGTIRAMLLNRTYIGELVWNRRQYSRRGGKTRTAIRRPESEQRRVVKPELAIVPRELWDAVQARFEDRSGRRVGRAPGTSSLPYLLSGLLRCASCGGSMSIISRTMKNGRVYASYGCSAHYHKGKAICPNNLTISERKAVEGIVGAIRDMLAQPGLVARFIERFNARVLQAREQAMGQDGELHRLEREIAEGLRRVQNVTEAISKLGIDDDLVAKFKAEKARLQTLRDQHGAIAALRTCSGPAPAPAIAEGYLRDLLGTLEGDPERARKVLAQHVGEILLTPKQEGDRRYYLATGSLDLSVALGSAPEATEESLIRLVAGAGFEPATFGL